MLSGLVSIWEVLLCAAAVYVAAVSSCGGVPLNRRAVRTLDSARRALI